MSRRIHSAHYSKELKLRLSTLLSTLQFLGLLTLMLPVNAEAQTAHYVNSALNFGTVAIGQTSTSSPLTFIFDSAGTLGSAPAVLTQGAPLVDFQDAGTGTCTTYGSGHFYNPGDACTVDVKFSPLSAGERKGAVILKDSSGKAIATAYVYGNGSAPMLAFGPGTITTVAGSYQCCVAGSDFPIGGYSGDGGLAAASRLSGPKGVALDGSGNLYIADSSNSVVRRVTLDGTITTVAGTFQLSAPPFSGPVGGYGGDGGPATLAKLDNPSDVAMDGAGNLYIADSGNFAIRRVALDGMITTVAGNPQHAPSFGYSGDGGPATSALLYSPTGIAVDGAGNLYIADHFNQVVRKVSTSGTITTVAGKYQYDPSSGFGKPGYSGDGGPATSAQLNVPYDVAVDGAGNLYIADSFNQVIRKVTPAGTITTFAGTYLLDPSSGDGVGGYSGDGGPAAGAQLNVPQGVALDGTGNLFISDNNEVIRKVSTDGTITTVAGNHSLSFGYSGDNGPATSARLRAPLGMVVDGNGNLYIAEFVNEVIRRVDVSDPPSLTFLGTYVGLASASQDVALINLGNMPLTISQISTAANFSLSGSDTSCSPEDQVLNPAASCVLGIEFNPAGSGKIGGSVVLTDNSLNASSAIQSINLQGTASLAPTTLTVNAVPMAVLLGGTTQLTASISSTITGNVTFYLGSVTLGSASISGGTATLNTIAVSSTNGFSIGSNSITASYGGDTDFASSSGSTAITVLAATSMSVASVPPTLILGATATLTAAVRSATAGAISGNVIFKVGSTTLGSAPISGGIATLSNVAVSLANGFSAGSDSITTSYSGDASFASSIGNITLTVVMPAYTLSANAAAMPLTAGNNVNVTLTLNSSNYAGTVNFSVTSSSPLLVSGSAPAVTLTNGGSGSSTMTIIASTSAAQHAPALPWKSVVMFCAVLLGTPFTLRRKRAVAVLLTTMAISMSGFLMACGGGSKIPARTYTVTVTPTGTNTVANPAPVSITVTVP